MMFAYSMDHLYACACNNLYLCVWPRPILTCIYYIFLIFLLILISTLLFTLHLFQSSYSIVGKKFFCTTRVVQAIMTGIITKSIVHASVLPHRAVRTAPGGTISVSTALSPLPLSVVAVVATI